jgi:hypothetical protein
MARPAGLATRPSRRHYRHPLQSLAYLILDHENGGIIRNVGQTGIAIQAVSPPSADQQVFLRFDLSNPRVHVEATGRVAWAAASGQAGIEFLALPQRSQRLLKEWIFLQLLTAALQAARSSIRIQYRSGEDATALSFSTAARPAIHLETGTAAASRNEEKSHRAPVLHLSWLPFALAPGALSRLVDVLILLSAVLFFAMICVAMTGVAPAWPVAVVFGAGVAGVFTALYWLLFSYWIGCTPGRYLARLACGGFDEGSIQLDERPRFR